MEGPPEGRANELAELGRVVLEEVERPKLTQPQPVENVCTRELSS